MELLVSTRKGLFTFTRSATASWQLTDAQFQGDRVSLTLADPRDGARYAALDHGHFGVKMHRSDDGGKSWPEIPAPAYPTKPEGLEDKDSSGKEVPWTNLLVWGLETGGADEPGALWCGTVPGGLFRSADRGETWHLVESLWRRPERKRWFGGGYDYPGIHSICVDPRDSKRVIVGVSCGGLWQTVDRGETWELRTKGMEANFVPPEQKEDGEIQDPHRVVRCPAAPDRFWVQHHCGVYRSTDGTSKAVSSGDTGAAPLSWTELANVPPSTFGFAAAVHPTDPDTAWFVPAVSDELRVPVDGKLTVARTRDGGATFEVLRRGLPEENSYDLVYRHALDVDSSGEVLAMGTTTGNLWVSHDAGDSWTALSHHLPPIAAVELVS